MEPSNSPSVPLFNKKEFQETLLFSLESKNKQHNQDLQLLKSQIEKKDLILKNLQTADLKTQYFSESKKIADYNFLITKLANSIKTISDKTNHKKQLIKEETTTHNTLQIEIKKLQLALFELNLEIEKNNFILYQKSPARQKIKLQAIREV